jgi:hypothetical protein
MLFSVKPLEMAEIILNISVGRSATWAELGPRAYKSEIISEVKGMMASSRFASSDGVV